MNVAQNILVATAKHGRSLLVAGLAAGIAFPDIALAMKPWLPLLVSTLLFLAALRIGHRQAFGVARDLPVSAGIAVFYQLVMPVTAILVLMVFGWLSYPIAACLVLMLSASPISGNANLTIMTGNDPAPALRLMVIGTALLPLTVLLPLWLMPEMGSVQEVVIAATRLMGVIAAAAVLGFCLRHFLFPDPTPDTIRALDGISAITMAIVVVGLMSAVGPAILTTPVQFLYWLGVACLANLGLQILMVSVLKHSRFSQQRVAYAISAGNRNIALFLVALPQQVTDPLLLFIGCYQIPMYLTPILLRKIYDPTDR
ncbi:MAG: hypothetical protein ACR2O0_15520 [Rhizobiaceae bacterium]